MYDITTFLQRDMQQRALTLLAVRVKMMARGGIRQAIAKLS